MERRSQNRLPDSELVTLSWEERSAKLSQLGSVHDRSRSGIGVAVDHAIPVGTPVTISFPGEELVGIVRHDTRKTDEHLIGIEFISPRD
jgi:hypothetical protein